MSGDSEETREIYHEVKNHMAVISSLLRLSASEEDPGPARNALEDTGALVSPVVLVYQMLYRNPREGISVYPYLLELIDTFDQALSCSLPRIQVEMEPRGGIISSRKAVPLGIMISELLLRRIRRAAGSETAFPGEIQIRLTREGEEGWILEYRESGDFSGARNNGDRGEPELLLVPALCDQLDGKPISGSGGPDRTVLGWRFPPDLISAG